MRLGLFSTLTGASSRALIHRILSACRTGEIGLVEPALLFVNRAAGESADTDASVAAIVAEFGIPLVRASAVAFRRDKRRQARDASAAGDDSAIETWRDAFYASYRSELQDTDLDLLLGDMWIWGPTECAERRGLNLHPALPTGPAGSMWFDVVWDLVEQDATESGAMLHRVTPQVDLGPVATFTRYNLRTPDLEPLWAGLPADPEERRALIRTERARKRDSAHALFHALRTEGMRREAPLMLETIRAVAAGHLIIGDAVVLDGRGTADGLDLTRQVEAALDLEPPA